MVSMAFVTNDEKTRIEATIREAERQTTGELVCVIAPASDDYHYIPTLWAAALSLVVPIGAFLTGLIHGADQLILGQMAGFAVLALTFRWPALKLRLIPKGVRRERAALLAKAQFLAQGLHRTEGGTGVLIFVSVAERYVEIVADHGIDAKVGPGVWQAAVDKFTDQVKAGNVADGFLAAVADCGKVLAEHFPAGPENRNELPNVLIEL
jgi:putative membrane protein